LAAIGGISISVSTVLCRKLNDAGVIVLASLSSAGLPATLSWVDAVLAIASLLIILPSYVNQVAISLASQLTVRVVLATAPALIFFVQLVEGRLSALPYPLTAAILYAVVAISAGLARQRAIRSTPVI